MYFVPSYSIASYGTRGSWALFPILLCSVWCIYLDTLCPEGVLVCLHIALSLTSLCILVWKHCTYEILVTLILSSVCLWNQISIIFQAVYGAICFQLRHLFCDDFENSFNSSYHHHIGNMRHSSMIRAWSLNGVLLKVKLLLRWLRY